MSYKSKLLGATLLTASGAFATGAYADVCDTPSALADLGNFAGETVTVDGSWQGKDEENVVAVMDCFSKATGATIK